MLRSRSGARVAVALAAALAFPSGAGAEERGWNLDLSVPVSYATGHTTYRIDLSDGVDRVASELEFPIRTGLLGVHARLAQARAPGAGRLAFEASARLAVASQGSAKLEDSDWLDGPTVDPGGVPGALDIYSRSDAKLSGNVLEARAALELDAAPGLVLAPMAGLLRQRLEYEVTDLHEVGFGAFAHDVRVSGRVLAYEVTHLIPYVGGRAAMTRGRFVGTAEAWFSPAAQADDEDDHLLRGKRTRIDASGSAWSVAMGARIALGARSAILAEASLLRVSASGTQRQLWYRDEVDVDGTVLVPAGTAVEGIPSEITSSRTTFSLAYVLSL